MVGLSRKGLGREKKEEGKQKGGPPFKFRPHKEVAKEQEDLKGKTERQTGAELHSVLGPPNRLESKGENEEALGENIHWSFIMKN